MPITTLVKRISPRVFLIFAAFSLPLSAQTTPGTGKASDDTLKSSGADPTTGTPAEAATKAFENGDHEGAVKLALPLAEKGDADALYLLGFAHETGRGVAASSEKAGEYYRKGMDKDHAASAYRLAFLLMASKDETSILEARAILEKKALTDPAVAGRILGEAFLLGRFSGQPDGDKAVSWWKKAGEAGDVASMLFLARFYDGQMGFPEKSSAALSLKWFEKAAEAGNTGAMVAVGSRLLYGDEKNRDEKRGLALLEKAIAAKDYSAYFARGTWHETVKKDAEAALADFERGKDAGQPESMIRAAQFYLEGKGTKKDAPRAISILKTAAEAGNAQAHLILAANALQSGKPDTMAGYKHLVAAASAGLAAAQNELGLFYLGGGLGAADTSAAVSWFGRAAQSNNPAAQNNLAALHERGTGVDQSYETAARLYSLAAQQGHAGATLALARFQAAGAATEVNRPLAWALATIAKNRGEKNAPDFLATLEKEFSKEQLAEAKKELARLTVDGKSE